MNSEIYSVQIDKNIQTHIFQLFKKSEAGFVYRGFYHTKGIVGAVGEICDFYKLEDSDRQEIELAAWFCETGGIRNYEKPLNDSVSYAKDYMLKNNFEENKINTVIKLIMSTNDDVELTDLGSQILHDAIHLSIGKKRFVDEQELIRVELENCSGLSFSDKDWHERQLKYITNRDFYTSYCLDKYESRRIANIRKQAALTQKERKKSSKLGRGIETMYRAVYRNHINLSSIADNKANMMISINTIIVSVIVAVVGSGFTLSGQDFIRHIRFTVPMCMLLFGSLISVIFAILSASPTITKKQEDRPRLEDGKMSVLFFGNFVKLEMEKFKDSLNDLRRNDEAVYNNMSVDLYNLGHVLKRKYHLLTISYLTFLGAVCLCTLTFFVIFIYSLWLG